MFNDILDERSMSLRAAAMMTLALSSAHDERGTALRLLGGFGSVPSRAVRRRVTCVCKPALPTRPALR